MVQEKAAQPSPYPAAKARGMKSSWAGDGRVLRQRTPRPLVMLPALMMLRANPAGNIARAHSLAKRAPLTRRAFCNGDDR
jgi:hypothetical protein